MRKSNDFSDAIASILCSAIGIDEQHAKFRELYHNSEREKLLLLDFEQDYINDAKEQILGEEKQNRERFINILLKTSGLSLEKATSKTKLFNFKDMYSFENIKLIISLFHELNIDVDKYNEHELETSNHINLTEYYKNEIKNLRPNFVDVYKCNLYSKLVGKSLDYKKDFVATFLRMKNDNINVLNSVNFNCEQELQKIFGVHDKTTINFWRA